jgi:DNA-binding protein YbaB
MTSQGAGGFAGFSRDPDEVERQIGRWADSVAAKAERYRAVQQETEQIRLSATSQDGTVRVTVRSDGSVVDLQFSDKFRTMTPSDLSARILATMRSAQSRIADRVGEVMSERLGDSDPQTRSVLLNDLRKRFPEEPGEPESTSEQVAGKWDYDDPAPAGQPPASAPQPPMSPPAMSGPATSPPAVRPPATRARPRPGPDDDDTDEDFDPLRD